MRLKAYLRLVSASPAICFTLAGSISTNNANAQVTGATLSGTVTDASGAVIPGVMIAIKNRATGVVRNATADEAGFYTAPNLLAGVYDITASAPGFNTVSQTNISLAV